MSLWIKFGEEDSSNGEFSNYRKGILQSSRKKKTLAKYPLYLHVIDKETDAQRVER